MATAKASPKSKADKAAPATSKTEAAAEVLTVHGIEVKVGDVKGGGSAKKPLGMMIPLKSVIITKGFNPRTHIDPAAVQELAENIKKDGQLSSIVVRPGAKEGTFDLVAGERRVRALQLLGAEEVLASIRADLVGDDDRAKAIAVAENADGGTRFGLNPIEMGRVFLDLSKKEWTLDRIVKETGVPTHTVRRCLGLMEAPAEVQKQVESGKMGMMAGLEIAKLDDATRKKIQSALSDTAAKKGKDGEEGKISAADVRALAKAAAKEEAPATDGKSAKKKTGSARDAAITAWKGSKPQQAAIAQLSATLVNAPEAEQGTSDFYEIRGALAYALWARGDLDTFLLPSASSDEAADKKVLAHFQKVVEAEAKKHKPAEAPAAEGEQPAEGAEEAPAAKTGKKAKAKG